MQKIYVNTATRTFYDSSGSLFADGFPKLAYKRSEQFRIQLCTDTPDAGTEGCDPEEWEKDAQYDLTGITALLSVDNDFRRRRKGTTTAAIDAGPVAQISATIANASAATIRNSGSLRVFGSDGAPEGFEYTSFTISGNTVTFALADGASATGNYASGSVMDVPDAIYMQAAMSNESDPANGLFVFDLVADSAKLRDAMEYSDTSKLNDIAGMELLLFTVANGEITECDSYVCNTVSVTATMAEANPDAQMPSTFEDTLLGLIAAALGSGMISQFSVDGSSWHDEQQDEDLYMRFRLTSTGNTGLWLVMRLKAGPPGTPGTNGANSYIYVAYASDGEGTNFSPTPSNSLKWRAEIHSTSPLNHVPVISDGTNTYDRNTDGDGDNSGTNYYAWVRDDTNYYTASETPLVGNTIFTDTALTTSAGTVASYRGQRPDLDDFSAADAIWVKYIGDDGTGVGDMLKSVYDTNDDGKVDLAKDADNATKLKNARKIGNADFDGTANISIAEIGAAAASHSHTKSAISDWSVNASELNDPVRQMVQSEANPNTLYLNRPVLVNSTVNSAGTIALDFTSVKDKNGDAYTGQSGDDFTWIYRLTSSVDITGISIGSVNSTMEAIDVPSVFDRLDGVNTTYVFVIHAIYDNNAINKLRMFVNYSHCFKAQLT